MQTPVDLSLPWDGDLAFENGDIQLVTSGTGMVRDRIMREIFTNPGDYLFHPEYGAGAGQFVGEDISDTSKTMAALVDYQLLSDPNIRDVSVIESPDPVSGIAAILVKYTDKYSGQQQSFYVPTAP